MKHTILSRNRLISFAILFSFISLPAWAGTVTTPANLPSYYSGINGKNGTTLWSAVHTVAGTGYSTSISYANVWTVYATTDSYMDGSTRKVYDMYGGCDFTYSSDQCGSYSNECDCYNREHSIPKSWFGGSEAANSPGSDVFHLVPTDGKINNTRSNYAFGEVQTAKTTHNTNGMVNKLSTSGGGKSITIENTMLGTSSTQSPGSSKQVFEPDDIYKGDFARGYFGTLLHWAGDYQAFTTGDGAVMFSGTYTEAGYWGLTPYGIALLLKWHRQDPVSQKEIDRNNGIQQTQGNRNPFIDYPILAEYIWGKYAGETFSLDNAVGSFDTSNFTPGVSDGDKNSTSPTIAVSTTSITMDPTANGGTTAQTFTITGANLTGAISIAKSGSSYITVSPTSITSGYNGTKTITVTYKPTATGSHSATLTISSTGATSKTVTVSGTCTTVYNVTWMADGSSYHSNTAASGNKPTLPSNNPDDCSASRVFMGWTASSSVSSEPADLFTDQSGAPNITTNKTFYAVYADKTTSGGGSSTVASVTFNTAGSDGSTDISSNISSIVSSASGISSYSGTKVYAGKSGAKLGSGSATGSITLTLSSTASVTQVTITGAKYGSDTGKLTVTAGSTEIDSKDPGSGVTYTAGSAVETNKITIATTSKRAYVTSITVTAGGGSTTYDNYSTQCSTVTCNLSSIALNTSGVQTTFTTGDTFTPDGLVVTASYTNCSNKTVTPTSVSSPNMSSAGTKTVTVSYTENGTTKTATYSITVNAPTSYTVTFKNNGATFYTATKYAGEAISVGTPTLTNCDDYSFVGWSESTYATTNTYAPEIVATPTTMPAANKTYYAVYSKTDGGASGAAAGTTLWSEDFSGYSADDVPSGNITNSHTGTTVYGGNTITYACTNGGGTTKIYDAVLAGGTTPEILIAKSNGSFSISSIPTGFAETMTLLFNTNKSSYPSNFSITSETSGISIGSLSSPEANKLSCTITNANGVETFDLTITYTYSQNGREDNFLITVATAGSSGTTYYTTSPDCTTCTATLTVKSPDDSMGTVGIQ